MNAETSILIVDDDPLALELLEEVLLLEGYNVSVAKHPESAIDLAGANKYDLALLDIAMPDMDGFELCRMLKSEDCAGDPTVIFISGRSDIETKIDGFDAGGVDYISKPFHPQELLARIKNHLGQRRLREGLEQERQLLAERLREQDCENIIGKYEFSSLIGEGGMSRVYKARHIPLDRMIALKILKEHRNNISESSIIRFEEEARAVAKIRHPNVVEIYDAGILQGHPYIAMELVDGYDLEKVGSKKVLSYHMIVKIMKQAASGLAAAHACKIIHRDIKPGNLLVDRRQVVRITDFGIAKNLDTKRNITEHGSLLGTPAYMAPELCFNMSPDKRSDVYSLGMTLFYLLTGKNPYQGSDTLSTVMQNIEDPLPDPRELREGIPASLLEIMHKMTDKEPMYRHDCMNEVLAELEACGL